MATLNLSTLTSYLHTVLGRRVQCRRASVLLIAILCIVLVATYLPGDATAFAEANEPHIVGGQDADRGEYPWQVMITDSHFYPFCGGSLIAAKWVLTAAHCVQGLTATTLQRIHLVLGAYEYNNTNETGRQVFQVARAIQHPDFVPSTFDNDVALIELTQPVVQSPWVRAINRSRNSRDDALWQPGQEAVVIGWGFTSEAGGTPAVLQEVTVPIAEQTECNSVFGNAITANMLCAGPVAGSKDACRGDSGGPLMVADEAGIYHVVGLVSWGNGCARPNRFGVYTRLSRYEKWIDDYVNDDLGATPTKLTLLANDGFDHGPDHSWQESSPLAVELIVNYGPVLAASGQHLAWLGGSPNQSDRIWQIVTMPQGEALFLNYQYQIRSEEPTCGHDQALLIVGQWRYKSYKLCQQNATSGWQSAAIKLDALGSQQVIIKVLLANDAHDPSSFFLDNIQFSTGRPLNPNVIWIEAAEAFDPVEGRSELIVPTETFLPLLSR
ncbi:MAG: serine protease [Caldilineaceae bacterium]